MLSANSEVLRKTFEKAIEKYGAELDKINTESQTKEISIPYRTAFEIVTTFLKSPYEYWLKASVVEKQY